MKNYKLNAVIIGGLFVLTMLFGMIDAYWIIPKYSGQVDSFASLPQDMLIGCFSVFAMALGLVGIAIAFYPIVKKQSEMIALTYLSGRVIECVLLIIGCLAYLYLYIIDVVL